ncbi:MAG: nitroreductase family protein [Rhodospirillales bacterium]
MTRQDSNPLLELFSHRFGKAPGACDLGPAAATVAYLAGRRSIRRYAPKPVDPALIETLAAAAFSAPTKSDLQQRDIVEIRDRDTRNTIDALFPGMPWIAAAPVFLVFCGNNRRQRQLHAWRGRPFANDHLDAFFNAAVDSAIILAAFVIAAEQAGLGCCPISAVRNHARLISDLLALPDHVFPVAGLAVGWPADEGRVSLRLPLKATLHVDRYDDAGQQPLIDAYDARRARVQPYARQRFADRFGAQEPYTWSEDKARQYSKPERADFGAFVRAKGFKLD